MLSHPVQPEGVRVVMNYFDLVLTASCHRGRDVKVSADITFYWSASMLILVTLQNRIAPLSGYDEVCEGILCLRIDFTGREWKIGLVFKLNPRRL